MAGPRLNIFLAITQARRQDFATGGQRPKRVPHFSMQYWMYAAPGRPNMKWGAHISNGGASTTGPPLATALQSPINVEHEAGQATITFFQVFGMTQPRIDPSLSALVAHARDYALINKG